MFPASPLTPRTRNFLLLTFLGMLFWSWWTELVLASINGCLLLGWLAPFSPHTNQPLPFGHFEARQSPRAKSRKQKAAHLGPTHCPAKPKVNSTCSQSLHTALYARRLDQEAAFFIVSDQKEKSKL
ncbi:hypothetical protein BCV70DRAFT_91294 [Testicularia cyperi]|uniref:Uncharacterized protein n=1 Tax=Testicularia cyperi TaxID=1882483 RepID=A0A317XSJ6_9BASI|nr:hypothetical protein BCV70DRAFT_91294 [Testicularia cyperi]